MNEIDELPDVVVDVHHSVDGQEDESQKCEGIEPGLWGTGSGPSWTIIFFWLETVSTRKWEPYQ